MTKTKRIRMISPPGAAVFPKLNEPDTKFKPEGEYTAKLAFVQDDPAVAKFVARLQEIQRELYDTFVAEKPAHKRFKLAPVFTEEVDSETGDETGRILINFKMKASGVSKKTNKPWSRKPTIIDAHKQPMVSPPQIGGGSILRVGFEPSPAPVQSSKLFYLSCRLDVVQLMELRTYGVDVDAYGFEEEEGYEADESTLKAAPAAANKPPFDTDDNSDDADEDEDF